MRSITSLGIRKEVKCETRLLGRVGEDAAGD